MAVSHQQSAVRKEGLVIQNRLLKADSRQPTVNMRIRLFFLVSFCLCLLPLPGSTAQESPDDKTKTLELPTFSVLQKTESFELKTGEHQFTVKSPPILPNSEQLTAASGKVLVRNVDYQIDFYPGKITITPLIRGDKGGLPDAMTDPYKLKITYRTLPFAIKEVYKRNLYGEQNPDSGQQSARGLWFIRKPFC